MDGFYINVVFLKDKILCFFGIYESLLNWVCVVKDVLIFVFFKGFKVIIKIK